MKKLLAFLLLALAMPAFGQRVTLTVTVTNKAVTGDTLVVNGVTRYFTNAQGSATFLTNLTSINATKTNVFKQIASYPLTALTLTDGGTNTGSASNQFRLSGTSISASLGGTWGYLTLSTQAGSSTFTMLYPVANVVGETNRTNQSSDIVAGLNTYATNLLATNAGVLGNYLTKGASTQQVVVAPVQFNGTLRAGGAVALTNGFARAITNINPVTSNLVNYGQAIRSEGSGGNSLQVGSNATASGALSMAVGNGAVASAANATALGVGSTATNTDATAIGSAAIAGEYGVAAGSGALATGTKATAIGWSANSPGNFSTAIGNGSGANEDYAIAIGGGLVDAPNGIAIGNNAEAGAGTIGSMAIGIGAFAGYSNSLALGPQDHAGNAVATTTTNQLRLGTANHTVSIPGQLLVSGTQSNTTFTGTNLARGAWAYPRYDLTTLAAGNNLAVPVGTNRFVRVGSGPASAATIVGMVGGATSGGIDGQDVVLYNDSGFSLTLAVNSVDPVPANRLNTPTATDVTIPDQGWAQFFYDGTDARWKLINAYSGTNLVATSTNLAVSTNGTLVGNGAINFTTGITGYLSGATLNLGVSAAGGGGSLVTNANQFGADTTLTIKDGALLTNVFVYGNNTNALRISSAASNIAVYVVPAAASSTGIVVKAAASQTADLLRFENSAGTRLLAIRANGGIVYDDTPISYYQANECVRWGGSFQAFSSGIAIGPSAAASSADAFIFREAAATLQLGTDAATATAQTIKAHDGSGTDKAGASLSINGGQSTGTGVGGALIKNTSLTGSTGSSANSYSVREYIYAGETTLTEGAATGFVTIALPASKYAGVHVFLTTHADDATDFQATTDMFTVSAVAKGTNISSNVQTPTQSTIGSTGTLTTAITVTSTTNNTFTVNCNATSSLTQTTLKAKWQIRINSDAAATVTPL
jgi:trimeric autotransporter adhesin